MAAIRKRGDRWQVQVRRSGYPLLTHTFRTRADAEAWGRLKEVELDRGEVIRVRRDLKSITLADLLARYELEVTSHKRGAGPEGARIKAIRRDPFAQTPLHQLSASGFADYRDRRLNVVASASVRRELAILQHCIEVAMVEWGIPLAANPVSRISKPKPGKARTRRLATQDHSVLEAAFLNCRNPIVRHVFLFALATGMRRGEVLGLTWRDINWCERTAFLPLTKNGESRLVPLSPSAVQVLQSRRWAYQLNPQDDGEAVVFPISANAFRLAWERVKRRAGVGDLRFHDLRHEAISRFFEIGLSVPEVALISGHRDPRMLLRYTHLRPETIARKLQGDQVAATVMRTFA